MNWLQLHINDNLLQNNPYFVTCSFVYPIESLDHLLNFLRSSLRLRLMKLPHIIFIDVSIPYMLKNLRKIKLWTPEVEESEVLMASSVSCN